MIFDKKELTISDSKTPLAFEVPKTDSVFGCWDRFLSVNGVNLYSTGIVCDSCIYCFKRLHNSEAPPMIIANQLSTALHNGLTTIDSEVLSYANQLIPDGDYIVTLTKIRPQLCLPGDANDYFSREQEIFWGVHDRETYNPQTEYYRLNTKINYNDRYPDLYIECAVPMVSHTKLDEKRINYYRQQVTNNMPTALAIGLWDRKCPENSFGIPDELEHIYDHNFLTHYIIDGHHKLYAAALEGRELTLLSYIRKHNYFRLEINMHDIDMLEHASDFSIPKIPIPEIINGILDLSSMALYEIEDLNNLKDIPGIENVEQLLLDENILTGLPDFKLPNLKSLNVTHNCLRTLPDFSHLPNLKELYLDCNYLTSLPDFNLPNLESLNVDNNNLRTLPDFRHLPKLKALHIKGNQLTDLPDFSHLPSLKHLYLSGNPLSDEALARLEELKKSKENLKVIL